MQTALIKAQLLPAIPHIRAETMAPKIREQVGLKRRVSSAFKKKCNVPTSCRYSLTEIVIHAGYSDQRSATAGNPPRHKGQDKRAKNPGRGRTGMSMDFKLVKP
jgi:hypothetical protein